MKLLLGSICLLAAAMCGCVSTEQIKRIDEFTTEIRVRGSTDAKRNQQLKSEAKKICGKKKFAIGPQEIDKYDEDLASAVVTCIDPERRRDLLAEEERQLKEFERIERERVTQTKKAKQILKKCLTLKKPSQECLEFLADPPYGSHIMSEDEIIDLAWRLQANHCIAEASEQYLERCFSAAEYFESSSDDSNASLLSSIYEKGCDANEGSLCAKRYLLGFYFKEANLGERLHRAGRLLIDECEANYRDSCEYLQKISDICDPKNIKCKELRLTVSKKQHLESEALAEAEEEREFKEQQLSLQRQAINQQESFNRRLEWMEFGRTMQELLKPKTPTPSRFHCTTTNSYSGIGSSTSCYGH